MRELTISFEEARTICDTVYGTRAEAERQAGILEAGGWRVLFRIGARFGEDRVILASVYHPEDVEIDVCPGDITYHVGVDDA